MIKKILCQSIGIKITYSIILCVIFGSSLFVSFDILRTNQFLLSKFNKTIVQVEETNIIEAKVLSPLLKFQLGSGYYSIDSMCFVDEKHTFTDSVYYYNKNKTAIIYDRQNNTYDVKCVSARFVNQNSDTTTTMYNTCLIFSMCAIVVAIASITSIWFFCFNWCQCRCKLRGYEETQPLV
ncbi:Hypothetical_protein [Hexamita inflata]|uniref:Hypothetical_protein n=1 Tax=Hexamita inflata TaxID=28002 RepID=A0AA86PZV3_9EUKA|nr:Hypothetical protein HINF_LOCUS31507 [Hexamita inflata]